MIFNLSYKHQIGDFGEQVECKDSEREKFVEWIKPSGTPSGQIYFAGKNNKHFSILVSYSNIGITIDIDFCVGTTRALPPKTVVTLTQDNLEGY